MKSKILQKQIFDKFQLMDKSNLYRHKRFVCILFCMRHGIAFKI